MLQTFLHGRRRHGAAAGSVEGVVVIGHAAHRLPRLLLPLLALFQAQRGMMLQHLGHLNVGGEVRRPSRWPWPVLVVLLALPLRRGVGLDISQRLLGGIYLTLQRQGGGPAQVLLAVEQVRRVLRLQAVAGAGDQSLGLVAGHLHDFDRQAMQRLLEGGRPGHAIALGVVGLQDEEVAGRFDGYQTSLLTVEVLIRTNGDLLGRHGGPQALLLLVGVSD